VVVDTGQPDPAQTGIATAGDGVLVNSGPINGLAKAEAIAAITAILAEKGLGRAAVNYRLRDWLLSGSASGAPRSRSSTARPAARCRCPTTSCRWCCPTCAARTWCPKGVSPLAAARTG
jgi:leucyl-tRNA synthetase